MESRPSLTRRFLVRLGEAADFANTPWRYLGANADPGIRRSRWKEALRSLGWVTMILIGVFFLAALAALMAVK
jgi:hypothetical protein